MPEPHTIILAARLSSGREQVTHVLRRDEHGHWRYGERQCYSDTCLHISHEVWRWQDVDADQRDEIVALFRERGFAPEEISCPPRP